MGTAGPPCLCGEIPFGDRIVRVLKADKTSSCGLSWELYLFHTLREAVHEHHHFEG